MSGGRRASEEPAEEHRVLRVRQEPIYIGGLDRSGKTTMRGFLVSHPNIAIPPVGSNMETYFYGRFGDLARPDNLSRCLEAMLAYSHIRVLDPDPERIRREFAQGTATYARLFSLFLMHYAEHEGKPRWGAQTGLIERYADHLFAAFPATKVIHMVRDPRDRYEASLDLWPNGKGRAGGATARWTYSVRLAERNLRRYPAGYIVIRYEDLVTRTEETLRDVCAFLGETFHPRMLAMSGAPERRERLSARRRGTSTDQLLSDQFIGRFRGRVPRMEIAFIQLHAGRLMRRHGYPLDRLDLSAADAMRFAAFDWPPQIARMAAWRSSEALRMRWPALLPRTPDRRTIVETTERAVA
jgi:Sulfotransferase family